MRIMIVDSSVLFREGVSSLLKDETWIQVVGETDSGNEALVMATQLKPDVILFDSQLSDGSGIETMRVILSRHPTVCCVILSASESEDVLVEAIRFGAKGFLSKRISKSTLISSLHALERGEAIIPRRMTARLFEEISRPNKLVFRDLGDLNVLTYREFQVLRRLGGMFTNREIASQLIISENTVRVHVHNILDKLHLRNRREAADFVRRLSISE